MGGNMFVLLRSANVTPKAMLRTYTVFNVAQIDGLPKKEPW